MSRESIVLCVFCVLAAAGGGAVGVDTDYASRAGAVLGTYRPAPPDRSPETTAHAAARFLDSLDEAQRRAARAAPAPLT